MEPEPACSGNKDLESYPDQAGTSSALKLDQETKHENEGQEQEGMAQRLELHQMPKSDDSPPNLEVMVSAFGKDTDAEHQDDKTAINDTVTGLEQLLSEAKHDDDKPMGETTSSLPSSPSTSSSSCSQSRKRPDSGERGPLDDSSSESETSESPKSESVSPDVLDPTQQWSMISNSPRSGAGNFLSAELSPPTTEWNMFNSSPMKSPPIQTMNRPAGYDPNRIPSSIFSAKPSTPVEWSAASNESLFSIYMGNNSFSRDHVFLMGDTKPEEWGNSPLHLNDASEMKLNESNVLASNPPPVLEATSENDKTNLVIKNDSVPEEELLQPTKKISAVTEGEHDKEKLAGGGQEPRLSVTASNLSEGRRLSSAEGARNSVSAPRYSNESVTSSGSFAFPLLIEGGRSESLKAMAGKQTQLPPQPQNPSPTIPKHAKCNWFPCIIRWPRCC